MPHFKQPSCVPTRKQQQPVERGIEVGLKGARGPDKGRHPAGVWGWEDNWVVDVHLGAINTPVVIPETCERMRVMKMKRQPLTKPSEQ